jgi:hypothetical protein
MYLVQFFINIFWENKFNNIIWLPMYLLQNWKFLLTFTDNQLLFSYMQTYIPYMKRALYVNHYGLYILNNSNIVV